MRIPNLVREIYHFTSPTHRKAAKERKKEYKAKFEEHKQENLKRVRRLSQLRGDEDPAEFLFDSAYGTGASRRSLHDVQPAYAAPAPTAASRRARGRPFSMIADSSNGFNTGLRSFSGYASGSSGFASGMSTDSSFVGRRSSSIAPSLDPSSGYNSRSISGLEMSGGLPNEPPQYGAAVPMPISRPRPRPISLPAALPMGPSRGRRVGSNNDWWMPEQSTPEEEHREFVQVMGRPSGERELRMSAIVA